MCMTIAEEIRVLCARLNISAAELARRTGQSPQSFSAKMKRESFTVSDLEKIADATGTTFIRKFAFQTGEEV